MQQKDRYSDILINLDETSINITSSSLKTSLALSVADRRWIDFITQSVNETWDDSNPGRPKTMGYVGSEEFIRLQFEEYLLSLISAVKCHNYIAFHGSNPKIMLPQVEGDPAIDFGIDWIDAWTRSENYRIWDKNTDSHLFDIVEPKHPCAGGLTIDDVQRRLAQQVQEFHLDERFAVGKEVLGRNLAAGKERASTVFNKLYADMEALREAQRRRHEEQKALAEKNGGITPTTPSFAPDLTKAHQTVQTVGSKAGAYMSSWATWAGEKRRGGWGRNSASSHTATLKKMEKENVTYPTRQRVTSEKFTEPVSPVKTEEGGGLPKTRDSFQGSIFDADAHMESEAKKTEVLDKVVVSPRTSTGPKSSLEAQSSEGREEQETRTNSHTVAEEVEAATTTSVAS